VTRELSPLSWDTKRFLTSGNKENLRQVHASFHPRHRPIGLRVFPSSPVSRTRSVCVYWSHSNTSCHALDHRVSSVLAVSHQHRDKFCFDRYKIPVGISRSSDSEGALSLAFATYTQNFAPTYARGAHPRTSVSSQSCVFRQANINLPDIRLSGYPTTFIDYLCNR